MSLFGNTKFNTHLSVPSIFGGKGSTKRDAPSRNETQLLGPDVDLDLELSFASTMSLNSPARDSQPLTPEEENPDHVPMDISPAPPRVFQPPPQPIMQTLNPKPLVGRPRAATSAARLFGRDMSNGHDSSSQFSDTSVSKSGMGTSSGKRLQRAALPTEWLAMPTPQHDENAFSQPVDIPSSPTDRMDVDTSFSLASSAPDAQGPLSAAPTITAFNFGAAPSSFGPSSPISAAPTVTTFNNLFYDVISAPSRGENVLAEAADISGVSSIGESPSQPFPKKRRSSSPDRKSLSLRQSHQHLFEDEDHGYTSSPAQSSPSAHKLERMASSSLLTNQKKPASLGLGMPPALALNANKKRPRRPALSAMIAPGEGPSSSSPHPNTAYPIMTNQEDSEEGAAEVVHRLPPVRRAFSAMLPPNLLDNSMSSDASFEQDPDLSSPAQAYAKRQQVKTIRRCDGTDDFRPITGVTALMKRDTDAAGRGLRRSEERENRTRTVAERDTPRSKYLNAGPGLGGFGDNEAHGKILPCHRVREDGLMRINPTTLNELLDGKYNSQLEKYVIIDCRFDYEYLGGHIPGAININTTAGVEEYLLGMAASKPQPSTSGDASMKTILVFHCEFSVKRAPTFAKHLRSKDRAMNNHVYPRVHYPEVYILEGGYSQYFSESRQRCQPPNYVRMDDPNYAASRKEDLDQFRKGKFGRTKSYAYGEAKMLSMTSAAQQVQAAQPKRASAPTGGSGSLFAAATAARTRRGGLQTLAEDGSVDYESDGGDTDIGDSPCPPPTKNVVYKGKKIGRVPLARAETYGPSRMTMGY
ncbi:hypothetical protein DICSQDRAFT_146284 [Dichomitus squalens LYAD-421 SS1]|uniref:uncharacterized protein n=1 Tax=Dichomitus squalens (strain LYAD-421) TaxID=732165 RepID=UPI000441544A|nr:uncharacterized protein DICSQDRAFT_146284 [Dichomitus squalens LYAD-421 SS1]EJF62611.1 hypothetical protein DICSQDRAFT_146284 [Dichomitus squalens LYAD-421 SS1]